MKKLFLSFWPIFIIFTLWILFSAPFFFKGQIPFAGDYLTSFFPPWSQYSQYAGPVKNNAMPDVMDQLYPWKHLVITDWKNLEIPLWNPYNFAGTPLIANYQSSAFTPLNLLFFLPFTMAWGLLILLQPLLAGVGMYLFTRKIGISKVGATISSVGFMFCSFLVTWMGYGTLSYAVGLLPLILFGFEGFIQTKKYIYIFLTSFFLAFSFVSGHFQMSLYVLLASFTYFLFRYIPTKNKKIILYGLIALVVGIFLAAPQIFPSIAFYSQSLRSTLFIRPEVIPWQYLITVVAPDFFGNPVTRNDWFGHYAEWGSYIGILPLLFACFSISIWKKNNFVKYFSLLGLFALLLATPTFLGDLVLISHIPVLATSAAGRIMVLFSFSLAVLAGFGYDSWVVSKRKYLLGAISILFLLLGWLVIFGKVGLSSEHVVIAKQNFLLSSILLGIILVCSIVTTLIKNKRFLFILGLLFVTLSCFDMYRFASKWQSFTPQRLMYPNVGVTNFLSTIKDKRALGNYGGQVSLFYQIPSIEGYDALYPQKIGEFVSYVADGSLHPASRSVVEFPKNGTYTKDAIDLLGISYIIHKISDTNKPWAFPFWQYPKDFSIVYQDGAYLVLRNNNAYPRAFVAGNYIIGKNDQDSLANLFAADTDRKTTLVLEKDPGISSRSQGTGSAQILSNKQNTITLKVNSTKKALLFLSDTYFPGWKAYVNGKETEILRADFAFRAVVVPEGTSEVVFSYTPSSFIYGILGFVGGILLLIPLYFFQKRRL